MRWLVIFILLAACAKSTEANLDEAADPSLHCITLQETVCDACDPYRATEECEPDYIEAVCFYDEWSCAPVPSVRQVGECRRAFAEEVSRHGCVDPNYRLYPVPECTRFDACRER